MSDNDVLAMLKSNLEIANTRKDTYLTQLLSVAAESIAREGISLTSSFEDTNLKVMYAAYLYRKRAGGDADTQYITAGFGASGMPRMLRYALNNRLLAQKMAGGEP